MFYHIGFLLNLCTYGHIGREIITNKNLLKICQFEKHNTQLAIRVRG